MTKVTAQRRVLIAMMSALAIGLAACGSSSSSGSSSASGSSSSSTSSGSTLAPAQDGSGEVLTGGKKGGTLTVFDQEDFEHFDPGEAYFEVDYEVTSVTQRQLYFYEPNTTSVETPDLASGPPIISDGGKTVTVMMRHGVHFSPPVNREVTSADVAYAIERGANPNVANPYFSSYFFDIVGASKATGGPISGIVTPNKYEIVFHLVNPNASFFIGALALPLSAPVPKEFAGPLDAKSPTTYGTDYLVATGPYMVKSDSTGKFLGIGYQPGKSATLVRNPNWNPATDPRPAYLNQININIGGEANVIGRQVLTGTDSLQNDTPAAPIVELAYKSYFKQLVAVPGAGDHYVSLNNAHGPFSNVNVRRAVWAALDRAAMVKADGGQITGSVATHFIYPGSDGYALSGGDHGPNVDFNNYPEGNAAVAAKYMKLAGYPSGKYTGSYVVKIVGASDDPANKTAAIFNNAVTSLGFKTNFTLVDQSVMYSKYCGVPKAEIDACPNVGWERDWADPQTLLAPTFDGQSIVPTNNSNWSQTSYQDAPGTYKAGTPLTPLDQAMAAAEATNGDAARAAAWAKVDEMLVSQAVAVPWHFDTQDNIEAADVNGINQLWNGGSWDYAWTSLK